MARLSVSQKVERLLAAGKFAAAGSFRQEVEARRRKRRTTSWRKLPDRKPAAPLEFLAHGGMIRLELVAGAHARDVAIRAERERWLPRLERWHAESTDLVRVLLGRELKRLRRVLGVPDPERKRALTRARVARWRARRRA